MAATSSTARPITGRFVLITTVAFFAVVISVNMVMMRFAITTLPGTEVDSAYSASLAYQREILAARQQNERGWQVQAHIERRPDGAAAVAIEARDHAGAPLAGLNFLARLQRPTDRRADRAIEVTEAGSGSFHGRAEGISAGQWDLVIEGDAEGRRMFLSKNRVVLN
ncbi:FixH family protein [Bradyrhizobium viridifuturi]|jgi:nitrogen fixation protein FixH|nr:FixH family protein [Bradyrhizobium viridifuturi]ERF82304.1 MAG: IclR family transcriptional regulator, mhp operon transcriptional activator [Bradyrhizobium sp. DFCI-1]MCA3795572.1 FixH family protein [Burkholderia sp.]OYU60960.1 MAG: nitrogen fixation protein FixH [Bradyrhizobium sp. PARBB1]PSO22590.1 nitrogen fixation protein FixH [Bradyrhizobium sp. MOS004]QRI68780.1 FixH family protein [Bradyrhizobium sp. PSBB068]HAQ80083.1 nitrogen fixation protein FixH [Bradyrhizobium sp.]